MMVATPTTAHERELDALALELIAAEDIAPNAARAEAEDQLAELMAYADGWDDQFLASLDPEIRDLAHTLMREEGLMADAALAEAKHRIGTYALYACAWDSAAFEAGNIAALDGSIPF